MSTQPSIKKKVGFVPNFSATICLNVWPRVPYFSYICCLWCRACWYRWGNQKQNKRLILVSCIKLVTLDDENNDLHTLVKIKIPVVCN